MTDTLWQLPTEPVLPPGRDPLDDLTTGELGTIGRALRYDPVAAVTDPTSGLRWPALAHVAWVWAKRTDPAAKLAPFLDATATQVSHLLRFDEDATPTDTDEDVAENPTDSAPGSASPGRGDSTPTS